MVSRQDDPRAAKETGTQTGCLCNAMQRDMPGGQPGAEELGMHSEETYSADKFAAKECFRGDS